MQKLAQKLIGIVLCTCMLVNGTGLTMAVCAKEAEGQIDARMTYISSYNVWLSISGDGIASISGSVNGKPGVTHAYVKVTLQKSVSGTWQNVESWEDSSDSRDALVDITYQVSKGTYRAVMTCSANDETFIAGFEL